MAGQQQRTGLGRDLQGDIGRAEPLETVGQALAIEAASILVAEVGRVLGDEAGQIAPAVGLEHCVQLGARPREQGPELLVRDRKSTRLNSSHVAISYAVFCLKKTKYT